MAAETAKEAPATGPPEKAAPVENTPRILVISCGGTVTGVAEDPTDVQKYTMGALNAEAFRSRVAPQLGQRVKLMFHDFAETGTGSPDFGSDKWLELARYLLAESTRSSDGFVLLVGTDVIEFAFFLYHVIALRIPVVLTGAYRHSTSMSPDGDRNVYHAILVAMSKLSWGRGVLWVSNDTISSAYYVGKHHANRPGAIHAGDAGYLGHIVDQKDVRYNYDPSLPTDPRISIDLQKVKDLPRVDILKGYPGSNVDLFFAAVEKAEDPAGGIVLEGMGAGSWSTKPGKEIMEYSKLRQFPVIVCRGPEEGHVSGAFVYGLGDGCIGGGNLSSMKAWVKLRLLLCKGASYEEIKKAFSY
ncbi:L-asparaginase II [Metarhizium guizhouense ARSEF 977]|uniref:asparaginase n=1 Tax=Metarhizium guizhouense (strain ARSEF 977) TaxID=1276136 RepID=A0A0B4GGI5_METGA|nr:L-asparaginase II [Metarhizium guizhouense ARSEF 977]